MQCRNYNGSVKWKHGRVTHRMSKLYYKVTLDDGRVWERHADQILRSGEYWDYPEEPLAEAEPNVPKAYDEAAIPQTNDGEGQLQPELEEAEAPVRVPAQHGQRPVRIRRPPARYTDVVCKWK